VAKRLELTGLNLNQEVAGQLADLDCSTSRFGIGEHGSIHLVHGGIITHIGKIDSGLEDIVPRCASFFQNDVDIFDDLGLQGVSDCQTSLVEMVAGCET